MQAVAELEKGMTLLLMQHQNTEQLRENGGYALPTTDDDPQQRRCYVLLLLWWRVGASLTARRAQGPCGSRRHQPGSNKLGRSLTRARRCQRLSNGYGFAYTEQGHCNLGSANRVPTMTERALYKPQ